MSKKIEYLSNKVHDGWWAEKRSQGFHAPLSHTGGSGKFEKRCDKCHADMYPYDELPENVKEYDRVTVRAVLVALEAWEQEEPIVP